MVIKPMSEDDITIFRIEQKSPIRIYSRLYYYQGNFFHPLCNMTKDWESRIKNMIKLWKKQNVEMVKQDRSHPEYKSSLQLFDEQMARVDQLKLEGKYDSFYW